MDGLIGQTTPNPRGTDPSPAGGRQANRTDPLLPFTAGRGVSIGNYCMCVCVCVRLREEGKLKKVHKVTDGSEVQPVIDLEHFWLKGKKREIREIRTQKCLKFQFK